ncbi:hypothetical protein [Paenibacillus campi]|uniref:hypothetical protein n=1 Tax=Paenibacillus campi TaxID=3106031 RepID=UPI002AFF7969|nr:hypothetical protein [Paenibacillus sp. SGZ-1014]
MTDLTPPHTAEKVKLSQWDALLLEALRKQGWSEQQLLELSTVPAQQLLQT